MVMTQKVVCLSVVLALVVTCGIGHAELKKLRTGTTIGVLKSVNPAKNKRDIIIEVLAPGEEKPRRYTVGAQKPAMIATINAAKVGDRVEIDWFDTVEGLCIEKFQVLTKEKSK